MTLSSVSLSFGFFFVFYSLFSLLSAEAAVSRDGSDAVVPVPIYSHTFDVPPSSSSIWPASARSDPVPRCGWSGRGFGYYSTLRLNNSNSASGAFVSNGSCFLLLPPVPSSAELAIRFQFMIDSVPTTTAAARNASLLTLVGSTSTDSNNNGDGRIEIGVGNELSNASTSISETMLRIRVVNGMKSCADTARGCVLDLPGFVQQGDWMDVLLSFSSSGFVSIYSNGTFVATGYVFKRKALPVFSTVLVGASFNAWSASKDGSKFQGGPRFRMRGFSVFNITFSNRNVSDLYYAPSIQGMSTSDDADIRNADISADGSVLYSPDPLFYAPSDLVLAKPRIARWSFYDSSLYRNDSVTGKIALIINGTLPPSMDQLNTVNFNGITVLSGTSVSVADPLAFNNQFSFQIIFKLPPLPTLPAQEPAIILFSCSSQLPSSSEIANSIRLIATRLFDSNRTSVTVSRYNITLQLQQGRGPLWQLSGLTDSVPESIKSQQQVLDQVNIIVTVSPNGRVRIYNHGILISASDAAILIYPGLRRCVFGGSATNNTANRTPSPSSSISTPSPASPASIGLSFASLWPFVLTTSQLSSSRVTNGSVSESDADWSAYVWGFDVRPDPSRSADYQGRGSAIWLSDHPLNVIANALGSSTISNITDSSGWNLVAPNSYLNMGSTLFGGDCTLAALLQLEKPFLSAGSSPVTFTLFEYTNGLLYPGADSLVVTARFFADNPLAADLSVDVFINGVSNPTGPALVPAAVRPGYTQHIVITFNSLQKTVSIYVDGLIALDSWKMRAPRQVRRLFGLVGRSLRMSSSVTTPMTLLSLAIYPQFFDASNVAVLYPLPLMPYSFSFRNSPKSSLDNTTDQPDEQSINTGTITAFDPQSGKPVEFHHCEMRLNPFGESYTSANKVDGTQINTPAQVPTPGVLIDNTNVDHVIQSISALTHALADADKNVTDARFVSIKLQRQLDDLRTTLAVLHSNLTRLESKLKSFNRTDLDIANIASDTQRYGFTNQKCNNSTGIKQFQKRYLADKVCINYTDVQYQSASTVYTHTWRLLSKITPVDFVYDTVVEFSISADFPADLNWLTSISAESSSSTGAAVDLGMKVWTQESLIVGYLPIGSTDPIASLVFDSSSSTQNISKLGVVMVSKTQTGQQSSRCAEIGPPCTFDVVMTVKQDSALVKPIPVICATNIKAELTVQYESCFLTDRQIIQQSYQNLSHIYRQSNSQVQAVQLGRKHAKNKLQKALRNKAVVQLGLQRAQERYDKLRGQLDAAYMEIGAMVIGGSMNVRTKFKLTANKFEASAAAVTAEDVGQTIFDISNGSHNDSISLVAFGSPKSQRLRLDVYRGAKKSSVTSAAMDGSFYWIDVLIVIDNDKSVSFYLWGKLLSTGKLDWMPPVIPRSTSLLGIDAAFSTPVVYGAIGLFSLRPGVISSSQISNLYRNDHPPYTPSYRVGPWYIEAPHTDECVYHRWVLDTKVNLPTKMPNTYGDEAPIATIYRTAASSICHDVPGSDPVCHPDTDKQNQCILQSLLTECQLVSDMILNDDRIEITNTHTPLLFSKSGPCTADAASGDRIAGALLVGENLFDDQKLGYATPDSVIASIVYFEPMIFAVPRYQQRLSYGDPSFDDSGKYFRCRWNTFGNFPGNPLNNFPLIDKQHDYTAVDMCGREGKHLDPTCLHTWMFDLQYLNELDRVTLARMYLAGVIQHGPRPNTPPVFDVEGHGSQITLEDFCSRVSLGQGDVQTFYLPDSTGDPIKSAKCLSTTSCSQQPVLCNCNSTDMYDYNLIIIPPIFRFQYMDLSDNSTGGKRLRPTFDQMSKDLGDIINAGNRFDYANRDTDPAVGKPKTYSLVPGEYIIRVETICNYRFTFVTNHGNYYTVGGHPIFDSITNCSAIKTYSTFHGLDADDNVEMSTKDAQMRSAFDPTEPYNPLRQTLGPTGHVLHHMSGTHDGAFGYQFVWISKPLSYRIFNVIFDMANSLTSLASQPVTAVTVNLVNRGDIQQSINAIHSISKTEEFSFNNEDSEDHHWETGTSTTIEAQMSFGFEDLGLGGSTSLSQSFSYSSGGSTTISTSYGKSTGSSDESQQWLEADVPPHSQVTATMVVMVSQRQIPYSADVEIVYVSGETQTISVRGVFSQVKTDSILVSYSAATPLSSDESKNVAITS